MYARLSPWSFLGMYICHFLFFTSTVMTKLLNVVILKHLFAFFDCCGTTSTSSACPVATPVATNLPLHVCTYCDMSVSSACPVTFAADARALQYHCLFFFISLMMLSLFVDDICADGRVDTRSLQCHCLFLFISLIIL